MTLTNDRDWAKARSVLSKKKSELAESLDSERFGYLEKLEGFWDRMDKAEDLASKSDKASLEKAENEFMEAEKIAALLPPDIALLKGVLKRIDEVRKQIAALTPESRFVKNPDGTIRDNKLNLDWWPEDNGKDITYDQALKEIAEMNTREKDGKWELPTMDELYSLYDENAPERRVDCGMYVRMATDMIHVTCWLFWASDKNPSGSSVGAVGLNLGYRYFFLPSSSYSTRFLPVRRGN